MIPFSEIAEVSQTRLVGDRVLQRDIHYTIGLAHREHAFVSKERPYNPNPTVELRGQSYLSGKGRTFRIRDEEHIYFFDDSWPAAKVPEFLRPKDIIPSGCQTLDDSNTESVRKELGLTKHEMAMEIYGASSEIFKKIGFLDIPFNKPLNRVGVLGGLAERYNSVNFEWEQYGEMYKPSISQKFEVLAGIIVRHLP